MRLHFLFTPVVLLSLAGCATNGTPQSTSLIVRKSPRPVAVSAEPCCRTLQMTLGGVVNGAGSVAVKDAIKLDCPDVLTSATKAHAAAL